MATMKAPFNFVPISDKVYFPDWADRISHDIPFSDGMSGTIELTIKAETPIFVRNGHTKADAEEKNKEYRSFSNINGNYFIPATSIKGAVRSVLEIMSFGKMRLDKNAKFAQREWGDSKLYPLKRQQQDFHCGWLISEGRDYKIIDCGKPARIGQDKIDDYVEQQTKHRHRPLESNFSVAKGIDLRKEKELGGKKYDPKTAAYKYELLKGVKLDNLYFSKDGDHSTKHREALKVDLDYGEVHGTIVLTGQPDKWKYPRPEVLDSRAGKFYEFVFKNEKEREYFLSEEEYEHFKFIYTESAEWNRLKKELEGNGIPVFFRVKEDKIKDFGIAYLYKLPYNKSPYDIITHINHKDEDKKDLADCIFGYTHKNDSLKGRVQFSVAKAEKVVDNDSVDLILGSPKASYYPIYIRQKGSAGKVTKYVTYNDGLISGWKRYPVRRQIWNKAAGSVDLDTTLYPLGVGTEFKTKIKFRNLREIELGALLSALTFHNSPDCYHQFGQGKPYGFGKVKLSVQNVVMDKECSAEDLMLAFEKEMCSKLWGSNAEWHNSAQISELFTLAREEITANSALFEYMNMSIKREENEFNNAKLACEFLRNYTDLINKKYEPSSLYEPKMEEIKRKEREEEEERQQQEMKRIEEEAKRKREEEERKAEERKIKIKEDGLSFLDEKYEDGRYKVTSFKGAKDRIDVWALKRNVQFLIN